MIAGIVFFKECILLLIAAKINPNEDFDAEIEKIIQKHPKDSLTFFSGYDCDSLALEKVTGFAKHIIPFFQKYPNVDVEFRTSNLTKIKTII